MADLNRSIFYYFYNLSHHGLFWDALILFFAEYLIYFLAAGYVILALVSRSSRRRLAKMSEGGLSVTLSTVIITETLHFFYNSPRPFEVLSNVAPMVSIVSNSFPSGHTAFCFALAGTLFLWDRLWGSGFLLAALLVGLGRISAGVHWPTDILGGIVTGLASAGIIRAMLAKYLEPLKNSGPANLSEDSGHDSIS